jgi:hypothetical protein
MVVNQFSWNGAVFLSDRKYRKAELRVPVVDLIKKCASSVGLPSRRMSIAASLIAHLFMPSQQLMHPGCNQFLVRQLQLVLRHQRG